MNEKNNSNNTFEENNTNVNSAIKLFENTSVFKSLLKIVFLAIVVSLATGIYVFADQILMVRVLPENKTYFSPEKIYGVDLYNKIIMVLKENPSLKINTDISSVIRTAVSLSSPLTLICTAITLMLGLGISINYSKMMGKKDYDSAKNVWSNGFYLCIIVSLLTSIILIGASFGVIPLQSKKTNLDELLKNIKISELEKITIETFLEKSRNLSIDWAKEYAMITIGFNIFNCYTMMFISLLNSEGKNGIPTIFILFANIINIGLDAILLYFTKLGISGAAIATAISWIISTIIFVVYIYVLNKKNNTLLLFKSIDIKKFKFDKTLLFIIFAIGISSFLRNASTAIFSIVQQSIYGSITNDVTSLENTYYLTILGAINPIYNLFYSAIVGVIRGARTVITYNHAKNNIKNVKIAYLWSLVMSIGYALIFFIFVCFILRDQLLWLFNIFPSSNNYNDAYKILLITMGQLPIFGLTVSGMLYFQATSKPIRAIITSITYGIIIGIPSLFIAAELAKWKKNMDLFIYSPLIIMLISGIIVCSYSTLNLFLKKEKKNDLNLQ